MRMPFIKCVLKTVTLSMVAGSLLRIGVCKSPREMYCNTGKGMGNRMLLAANHSASVHGYWACSVSRNITSCTDPVL